MISLVWLFEEHRRLAAEKIQSEKDLAVMREKFLRAEDDNKRLVVSLEDAQKLIAQLQQASNTLGMFEHYQKQILQEVPFDNGAIPDNAWLTPGDTPPVRNDA